MNDFFIGEKINSFSRNLVFRVFDKSRNFKDHVFIPDITAH